MENASKALMIAAGVLIGLIIVSLGVYLFYVMGDYSAKTQREMDINKVNQFNDKFLRYNGLEDLTIQDVVTVKNYALENNREGEGYNPEVDRAGENNAYIDVYCAETRASAYNSLSSLVFRKNDDELLQEELEKLKADETLDSRRFTCDVYINTSTGRVNRVYFYPSSI